MKIRKFISFFFLLITSLVEAQEITKLECSIQMETRSSEGYSKRESFAAIVEVMISDAYKIISVENHKIIFKAPPSGVLFFKIYIMQKKFEFEYEVFDKVEKMLTAKDLPLINVVKFKDGYAIYDGHHRLMTAWALDDKKIKVNLVTI